MGPAMHQVEGKGISRRGTDSGSRLGGPRPHRPLLLLSLPVINDFLTIFDLADNSGNNNQK